MESSKSLAHEIKAIQPGKEWYYITTKIAARIGAKQYKTAFDKKKSLSGNEHTASVLHNMGYFTYQELQNLVHSLFAQEFPTLKKGRVGQVGISLVDETEVQYFFEGEEVAPCFCPSVLEPKVQLVLQYDDYLLLVKNTELALEGEVRSAVADFNFEDIVKLAAHHGASDIHIVPKEDYYRVFLRRSGDLIEQKEYLMDIEKGYEFVKQIKIDATPYTKGSYSSDKDTVPQEARIEFKDMGLGVDVRLQIIPDGLLGKRLCVIARVIKRVKIEKANLESKGFEGNIVRSITDQIERPGGLIVVSGVTGSGKSTFVAEVLSLISPKKRIFTIEDPIEYIQSGKNITQHQIYLPPGDEPGMGYLEFAKALKRADPDVVNIGEMRNDPALVAAIFEMASAGQLIFTTVHVRSAFELYDTLDHVFEVKYERVVPLIFLSINIRLTKKLCEHCKEEDVAYANAKRLEAVLPKLPFEYKSSAQEFIKNCAEYKTYVKGQGCLSCSSTGFNGRVPIYEFFEPNIELIEWMLKTKPSRYEIEDRVCRKKLGQNKLDTFVARLIEGEIDTCSEILTSIM